MEFNKRNVVKAVIGAGLIGMTLATAACTTQNVTQEQLDQAKAEAYGQGAASVDPTSDNTAVAQKAVDDYKASQVVEPAPVPTPVEQPTAGQATVSVTLGSYTKDPLYLGDTVTEVVLESTRLPGLKRGSVFWKSDEYDYREQLLVKDVSVGYSGDSDYTAKFGDAPRLVTGRGSFVDQFLLEQQPEWTEVSSEDPFEFSLLNKPVRVVKADPVTNSLTVQSGEKFTLHVGETVTVGGKVVVLESIGTDAVAVSVDGYTQTISENKQRTYGGNFQVRAEELLATGANGEGRSSVSLVLGELALDTIQTGDPYFGEDDSRPSWVWNVDLTNGIIGVKHDVRLNDEDEALKVGDKVTFPNNYAVVELKELTSTLNLEDYEVEVDNVDIGEGSVNVLKYTGEFQYDSGRLTNEVVWDGTDFRVYDGSTRTYVVATSVCASKADDVCLNPDQKFENLDIDVDLVANKLTGLTYNGVDVTTRDEDVLSARGFVVESPEDNFEDNRVVIKGVTEEKREFALVVKGSE